jgi:hypothetical protein
MPSLVKKFFYKELVNLQCQKTYYGKGFPVLHYIWINCNESTNTCNFVSFSGPVPARSEVWVCGRSVAGIADSNGWLLWGELSGRGICVGLITRPEECCQGEVCAWGWSLVQRSPTACGVLWVWSWSLNSEEAQAHWGAVAAGWGWGVDLKWHFKLINFFYKRISCPKCGTISKYVASAKNNNGRNFLCVCRLCKCSPVNYMPLKRRRTKRRIRLRAGRHSFSLSGHCTSWLSSLLLSVVAIMNFKTLRWWRHVIQSWYSMRPVLWNRFT